MGFELKYSYSMSVERRIRMFKWLFYRIYIFFRIVVWGKNVNLRRIREGFLLIFFDIRLDKV